MASQNSTKRPLTIAVMQPYFIPYAGYLRLFAASDVFVAFDCVQFTRSGWLHRNKLHDAAGQLNWLTLPLRKAPQSVMIRDLMFREDAAGILAQEIRRFPAVHAALQGHQPALLALLLEAIGSPVDYIERLLVWAAQSLDLPHRIIRSSSLDIAPELRGEDRILAIAAALGATAYVNAPGGVGLYDADRFRERGVELRFLPPFEGPVHSVLERILTEDIPSLRAEIMAQLA
jgi:hypothetical protein